MSHISMPEIEEEEEGVGIKGDAILFPMRMKGWNSPG